MANCWSNLAVSKLCIMIDDVHNVRMVMVSLSENNVRDDYGEYRIE